MGGIRRNGKTILGDIMNERKPVVFCVDDEESIREVYSYSLEGSFDAHCFQNENELFAALKNATPDVILLDVMLEGADGFEILKRIKSTPALSDVAVIMVSAKGAEIDKVKGLNLGADDYVAKPFGILEIIARINANIRKKAKKTGVLSYKDIRIDDSKHEVYVADEPVVLTVKEYDLLKLLVQNHENVVRRNDILDAVWGKDYGETRTLDIHVAELRKAISHADAKIVTVRGVGYSLK